jgi:hypothetical protein
MYRHSINKKLFYVGSVSLMLFICWSHHAFRTYLASVNFVLLAVSGSVALKFKLIAVHLQ